MNLEECLRARRSVRKFEGKVSEAQIDGILRAGAAAPSGKNGQPWRFFVLHRDAELKKRVAACTVYEPFVSRADCLIAVLLDKTASYHYVKDVQAIGACIENMLLKTVDLGLGACWIGEILSDDLAVKKLLKLGHRYDLMALVAIGGDADAAPRARKKTLASCVLGRR